jgi:hypothetical protein
MMQYHQDTKVRCVQLKCSERNKEYLAPTVELVQIKGPVEAIELMNMMELSSRSLPQAKEKPKRGRPKAS